MIEVNDKLSKHLSILLESEYVIDSLETNLFYMRLHDGIDGESDDTYSPEQFLSVFCVEYGDACIIFPPKNKLSFWRFRNCSGGGGQSPRLFKALIVLMEAIRRDNEKSLDESFVSGDKEVEEALDFVLEENFWIGTIDIGKIYKRKHDDIDGRDNPGQYLSLFFDSSGNSDIHIAIEAGKYRTLRFRAPAGGGESERTRKALMIIAEAIRRDNEKNPES